MAVGDMFEGAFEGSIGTGLVVGLGIVVLGPLLRPVVATIVRPAAKVAIRGGIYAYGAAREAVAQAREMVDDMVAEARSEVSRGAPAAESSTPHSSRQRVHGAEPPPTPSAA